MTKAKQKYNMLANARPRIHIRIKAIGDTARQGQDHGQR